MDTTRKSYKTLWWFHHAEITYIVRSDELEVSVEWPIIAGFKTILFDSDLRVIDRINCNDLEVKLVKFVLSRHIKRIKESV